MLRASLFMRIYSRLSKQKATCQIEIELTHLLSYSLLTFSFFHHHRMHKFLWRLFCKIQNYSIYFICNIYIIYKVKFRIRIFQNIKVKSE